MIWGAIGYGFKSKLVFLKKSEGHRGIDSQAYADQVLSAVVIPLLEGLEEHKDDILFMEDGAPIHKRYATKVRLGAGIHGFIWPPSSPDFNPIEKVWRWMKMRITQMEIFPTTVEDLEKALQDLWDELDPAHFMHHIDNMPAKMAECIKQKGMSTKY